MAIEIINKTGGAFPVTRQVGSSADHAGLPNDCYFEQIDLNYLVRYKDSSGAIVDAFSAAGGVFGIANTSGQYTYYSTLTLAMASAVSGDTIEMFANVTETEAVSITLKDNVNINGNGNTYTHSHSAGDSNSFINTSGVVSCIFSDIRIIRSGRTLGTSTDYPFYATVNDSQFFFNNVFIESTYGNSVYIYGTTWQYKPHTGNLYSRAYLNAITSQGAISGMTGQSTSSGKGIYNVSTSVCTNCVGISISGDGINGFGNNCYGYSTSGIALAGTFYNSYGNSITYRAGDGNLYCNCTLISSSGFSASNGQYKNCTLISSSGSGAGPYLLNKYDNCYIESTSNIAVSGGYSGIFRNCVIVSNWNNSGGHGLSIGQTGNIITNCHIKVSNTSANNIYSASAISVSYASNIYEGATTPVNANITQVISNTQDSQGNIKI